MFDTVIVPLDGTPHAEFVLPYASAEARQHGAELVLIHVIPRPEPCTRTVRRAGPLPQQVEWPAQEIAAASQEATAYLQDVVTRYALDPGTRLCVAVGDVGVRVAAEAARHARPLVVMLTGDVTREARPPLSKVANYLLIAGAVPVLGIRQPPPTPWSVASEASGSPKPHRLTRPGPLLLPSSMLTATADMTRKHPEHGDHGDHDHHTSILATS